VAKFRRRADWARLRCWTCSGQISHIKIRPSRRWLRPPLMRGQIWLCQDTSSWVLNLTAFRCIHRGWNTYWDQPLRTRGLCEDLFSESRHGRRNNWAGRRAAIYLRVVKQRLVDAAPEIVWHQKAWCHPVGPEHTHMSANPVRQCLRPGRLGIGEIGRCQHRNEYLGQVDLAGRRIWRSARVCRSSPRTLCSPRTLYRRPRAMERRRRTSVGFNSTHSGLSPLCHRQGIMAEW
jgi:hypothetical protein